MNDPVKQIIVVRKDLIEREEMAMTPGKLAAQVAHAAMAPILEKMYNKPYSEYRDTKNYNKDYDLRLELKSGEPLKEWLEGSFAKVVVYVKSEEKLINLYNKLQAEGIIACIIKDDGRTIFDEPTITCLGIEPLPSSVIGPLTKRLQLLG